MDILARIRPLNAATGARPLINVTNTNRSDAAGHNNETWWPAITRKPILAANLWEPGFGGGGRTGGAVLELNVKTLLKAEPAALSLRWPGALIEIAAYVNDAFVPLIFRGQVTRLEINDGKMRLEAEVDERKFQAPVLTQTYAGTGGIEGGADLRGRLKPWALGWPKNVEPVLIDAVNSVFQVSAYGSIQAVSALYERAASFGSSFGNYATYAALVAANIPPGRWATCNAQGLIRLGAPPVGVITADVQGDNGWLATWRRLPGDIIARLLDSASLWSSDTVQSSIDTLNVSVPRNISLYLTQQVTAIDLVREIAGQCNAIAGISWTGQLYVSRVGLGSPVVTAEVPALRRPVALRTVERDTQGPFWRMEFQAERCWRVHRPDEIAFYAEILDRGDYLVTETYREGNIVTSPDGSRWIYVNPTPTAGNAPPAWPTASNAFWSSHAPPVGFSQVFDDGTKPAPNATRNVDRGAWVSAPLDTSYIVGDEVQDQGSTWGCILAHTKTALNGPPSLPTTSNTNWRLRSAKGDTGPQGPAGLNNAIIYLYQRSATQPALPSGTFTYTFTGALLTGGNLNGWTQSVPAANGLPLWVIAATASSSGATDTLDGNEFSTPVIDSGAGVSVATITLYQRAPSTPAVPSTDLTYTFATNALSGSLGSWSRSIPAGSLPLYVTQATALSVSDTDTIAPGEWSAPVVLAQDGAAGPAGATGPQGPQGTAGAPGTTFYEWVAFANSPNGVVDFTTGAPDGRAFIGRSTGRTTPTESTDPADYVWSQYKGPPAFGLVARGNAVLASDLAIAQPAGAWGTAGVYSSESFTGAAAVSFAGVGVASDIMVGLNSDPATDDSWTSLDFAFYLASVGVVQIYESGNFVVEIAASGSETASCAITYDGRNVRYYVNGSLVRTVATTAGRTFWLDSALASGRVRLTGWGPGGPAGTDGSPGPQGPTGATGPQGAAGADGSGTLPAYRRSATQPATPSPSSGIPAGWYAATGDVPAGPEPMWVMLGTKPNAPSNWTWPTPTRHEAISAVNTGDSTPLEFATSAVLSFSLAAGESRIVRGQLALEAPTGAGDAQVQLESRQAGGAWSATNGALQPYAVGEPAFPVHQITVTNSGPRLATFEVRGTGIRSNTNSGPATAGTSIVSA